MNDRPVFVITLPSIRIPLESQMLNPVCRSTNPMNQSAEHLLKRVRDKNDDALAEYIELNRGSLMGFIERQLGVTLRKKIEPEDIFQEVTVDAIRVLADIELGDREPFSWLCQIAERRIIDAHRRFFGAKKRDAAREVALGAPGGSISQPGLINMLVKTMTTPSQAFSRNARELKLMEAIGTLPEDQQEALRLRYIEGLPSKEIAKRLEKSDGAIRVMLTRSLKRLQSILKVLGETD